MDWNELNGSMILQFIESLNRNALKILLSQVCSERMTNCGVTLEIMMNYGVGLEIMMNYGVGPEIMMNYGGGS